MSDKPVISFAVPVATITTICLCLLAACETGGKKDIEGISTTTGAWSIIDEEESNIFYVKGTEPKISLIKYRLRNNTEYQELIILKTDSYRSSSIYATYLPYDTYYSLSTIDFLHDKSKLIKTAKGAFVGASIFPVMDAENANGKYLYLVGKYDNGENCVMAREGISLKFTATRTEMTYDAIVRFRYCSQKSVQEILDIFDGIYLKK